MAESAWKPVTETSAWKPVEEEKPLPGTERTGIPGVPLPHDLPGLSAPPTQMHMAGIGPMEIENYPGVEQLKGAIPAMANSWKRGTSDLIEGAGKALAPLAIPGAIKAPLAAVGALGGGYLGSKAGELVAPSDPESQRLAGNIGGLVGGTAGGIGGNGLSGMLPSKARAGENFQAVMSKAKDIPIDVGPAGDIALRMKELQQRGSTMPKIGNDFLNLTTNPNLPPVTYETGRDLASAAGRLSVQDRLATNPPMRAQVAKLADALSTANADAAKKAGMLDEYNAAMKEYRSAMRLEDLKTGIKKHAVKAAIGTGLAYELASKYFGGK